MFFRKKKEYSIVEHDSTIILLFDYAEVVKGSFVKNVKDVLFGDLHYIIDVITVFYDG
jgi:hypothetical protein